MVEHIFETINSIETKFEHRLAVNKKTSWQREKKRKEKRQRCLIIIQDGGDWSAILITPKSPVSRASVTPCCAQRPFLKS